MDSSLIKLILTLSKGKDFLLFFFFFLFCFFLQTEHDISFELFSGNNLNEMSNCFQEWKKKANSSSVLCKYFNFSKVMVTVHLLSFKCNLFCQVCQKWLVFSFNHQENQKLQFYTIIVEMWYPQKSMVMEFPSWAKYAN